MASYTDRHKILRSLSKGIDGTAHTGRPAVENMGIDHRSLDVILAQEFLYGPDIVTALDQVRPEPLP